jgi:hypothetical protein
LALCIVAFRKNALSRMPLSIVAVSTMALSIMAVSITARSIGVVSITALSIMELGITIRKCNTQKNDSTTTPEDECCYFDCSIVYFAYCRWAECRWAECRGSI